jgi:putative membrane protein
MELITIAHLSIEIIALIHAILSLVEIFLWKNPKVHQRLDFDQAEADKVAPIVANAGLYNGFLAAGLLWSVLAQPNIVQGQLFLLSCVCIAGVFGAFTLRPTTLIIQTVPSLIGLYLVWLVNYSI